MWMQEEFGYSIGQASLAFSCASIAYAIGSPLAGSVTDCVPTDKRKYMINAALYLCGFSSMTIGKWQLSLDVSVRRVIAYVFCSQEGLCSTFLQAPVLPTMQDAAQKADKEHRLRRYGYITTKVAENHDVVGGSEAEEDREEVDEMTTNITTSLFTTIRMGGAILGPAVGAEIVAKDGFRTAIPFWGLAMLIGGVIYSAQLLVWAVLWGPSSKPSRTNDSLATREDLETERQRLVSDTN
jgi:MFS family permease|eukprot:COSAG02_NODE_3499_length_6650_cov_6.806136_1_plen_239_part_00